MKILPLNNIKAGIMASVVALSAVSCANTDLTHQERLCDEAKNNAMEYLTGEEYLQAKTNNSMCSYAYPNKLVNYWDSINTEYKVKRAYLEGAQMIRDSIAGKDYKKPEYTMPVELNNNYYNKSFMNLVDKLTYEVAANTDAKTIAQLIKNQPKIYDSEATSDWPSNRKGWIKLHFWNNIISIGKQLEAFNKGVDAEKTKLNIE